MNDTDLIEARRIYTHHADLFRTERSCLADLLLSVGEFEARGLHRALGHAGIFDYLHRALRMSRGMAHYRMVGARLMRRFPDVEEPIRDGRLCLTVVVELARVMTEENRAEVLPRFFGLSREEARQLAVEIEPEAVVPRRTVVVPVGSTKVAIARTSAPDVLSSTVELDQPRPAAGAPPGPSASPAPVRTTVEPKTATESRLHITVSREFLALLKRAKAGESHRNPGATDEQVLKLALAALIEKQGKRQVSVPAKVKREVVARDRGRCQWKLADGTICGATVRLEIDHVIPRGRGGPSTADNCRILCKSHNLEAARRVYGDAVMDLFAGPSLAREPCVEYLAGGPGPEAVVSASPRRVRVGVVGRFTESIGSTPSGETTWLQSLAAQGPARATRYPPRSREPSRASSRSWPSRHRKTRLLPGASRSSRATWSSATRSAARSAAAGSERSTRPSTPNSDAPSRSRP
jgi:5-methylcytosine-specific restriction endonuclease McrA